MAYTKIGWKDKPSALTPINAKNLNHMEDGIYQAHKQLETTVKKVNGIAPDTTGNVNIEIPDLDLSTYATKSEVSAITSSIASGSPKGVFSTLEDLQSDANANSVEGKKNIYLVIDDGNWYFWSGNAWVAGGVYQSTGLDKEAATGIKIANDIGVLSPNLFNIKKATLGKYMNMNGVPITNPSYNYTDMIPVKYGKTYYFSNDGVPVKARFVTIYSLAGNPQGVEIEFVERYKVSNCNIGFIVVSYSSTYNKFQVQEDAVTEYCEYGKAYVKTSSLDLGSIKKEVKDDFLLFLPSEICVATGRTIELYNKQVCWTGNINNYHFKWDCQVGKPLERKLSITGVTEGEYPLTLTVYDNNMEVVATATSTVKVVSDTIASEKDILTIGDSLTNTTSTYKPTWAEIKKLSENKFNFVGTRGLTVGEKHEGRSGWSAATYLTGASYTYEGEGVNPFWDGTRFNWDYYKTNTGINPDAVQIWLGTNGMELDPTTNAGNIKRIIDYIRQDDASIPIFVVYTLFRGNQNGIGVQTSAEGYTVNKGAWKLEEDRKVFNLIVKLNELLGSYTNLYFVPVAQCHDNEYNFGAVETPVNPRATQTELMPVEATHPQEEGYLQIADIMFSVFAAHLNN